MGFGYAKYRERIDSIDFAHDATNIYRTKQYIVKQNLSICVGSSGDNVVMSTDTYYLRTMKRDKDYEFIMVCRKHIDGKRMKSAMFTRRYVD